MREEVLILTPSTDVSYRPLDRFSGLLCTTDGHTDTEWRPSSASVVDHSVDTMDGLMIPTG